MVGAAQPLAAVHSISNIWSVKVFPKTNWSLGSLSLGVVVLVIFNLDASKGACVMVANCLKLVFVMLDANLERSLMSIVYDEKLKDGNKKSARTTGKT